MTTYPGAFIDWDNSARYKERATIFKGVSPERFEYWFSRLVDSVRHRSNPEKFIFLNAWNEWSESTYLEPDEQNECGYLDAIKKVLNNEV